MVVVEHLHSKDMCNWSYVEPLLSLLATIWLVLMLTVLAFKNDFTKQLEYNLNYLIKLQAVKAHKHSHVQ